MSETPLTPRLFGDLLALARLHWVREMAIRLDRLGYPDYRRSDAIVVRQLLQGPVALGRLGGTLGVTRQGARKVVDGLVERRLVTVVRDLDDARRLNVALTAHGESYARSVVRVVHELNDELGDSVTSEQLHAAAAVLQTVVARFA